MMYFYYQADHRISDSKEDVVLRQILESPHPYAILALRMPREELPLPPLSWGHPYPTAPAGAQMRFPLLRPSAAFMPSAMVKLMFPVAGTAFLCGGRAKSYPRVLICKMPPALAVPSVPWARRSEIAVPAPWAGGSRYGFLFFCPCCSAWLWTLLDPGFLFLFLSCSLRWWVISVRYCTGQLYSCWRNRR